MSQLLSLACFLAFLFLGLRVRRASGASRRSAVNALIACAGGLTVLSGLTHWDNWPFTRNVIAVGRPRPERPICMTDFVGVGADGRESRVDPYTWAPVYDSVLQYWFEQGYAALPPAEQRTAMAFLLQRAEAARARRAQGKAIGFERRLGAAASPYWLMLPRPEAVPSEPYVGLRAYRVCWTAPERARDRSAGRRTLVAEHRP
jgi:hypothetical protein